MQTDRVNNASAFSQSAVSTNIRFKMFKISRRYPISHSEDTRCNPITATDVTAPSFILPITTQAPAISRLPLSPEMQRLFIRARSVCGLVCPGRGATPRLLSWRYQQFEQPAPLFQPALLSSPFSSSVSSSDPASFDGSGMSGTAVDRRLAKNLKRRGSTFDQVFTLPPQIHTPVTLAFNCADSNGSTYHWTGISIIVLSASCRMCCSREGWWLGSAPKRW
jgi:hypothetical protein